MVDLDYEVCSCRGVTLGEILHAIKEYNITSTEEITSISDAGSICHCCKSKKDDYTGTKKIYLEVILKETLIESINEAMRYNANDTKIDKFTLDYLEVEDLQNIFQKIEHARTHYESRNAALVDEIYTQTKKDNDKKN